MPSTPAATIPNRVRSPSETLKPANSMIASLGTGMQAHSSSISTKTPSSPTASMKSVAALTIGSRIASVIEAYGSAAARLSGSMRTRHVTRRTATSRRKLAGRWRASTIPS